MAGRQHLKRDEAARNRREILRRASLYTVVFFLAGLVVAGLGAALVALLLRMTGLPFLRTWLVLFGIVVVAAALVLAIQNLRERRRRGSHE